jgi:hypothetical protein
MEVVYELGLPIIFFFFFLFLFFFFFFFSELIARIYLLRLAGQTIRQLPRLLVSFTAI